MKYLNNHPIKEQNHPELEINGLKCDSCDYTDMSVPFSDYEKSIGKPCPKCGASLLTQEDYDTCIQMKNAIDSLKNYSMEDLLKIQSEMSEEDIDKALDAMNSLQMKKTSVDDDGTENWSIGKLPRK